MATATKRKWTMMKLREWTDFSDVVESHERLIEIQDSYFETEREVTQLEAHLRKFAREAYDEETIQAIVERGPGAVRFNELEGPKGDLRAKRRKLLTLEKARGIQRRKVKGLLAVAAREISLDAREGPMAAAYQELVDALWRYKVARDKIRDIERHLDRQASGPGGINSGGDWTVHCPRLLEDVDWLEPLIEQSVKRYDLKDPR
jgi:hypothetical protein